MATKLGEALQNLESLTARVNNQMNLGQRSLLNMREIYKEILANTSELGDQFVDVNKLERKMVHDAQLFQKVQRTTMEYLRKSNQDRINDLEKIAKKEKWSADRKRIEAELLAQHQRDLIELAEDGFRLEEKKMRLLRLEALELGNIKKGIDDMGQKIRHPDQAFNSILASSGEIPGNLFKAAKEGKGLWEIVEGGIGKGLTKIGDYSKILFSPAGLLIGGVLAGVAAFTILYKLFSNYFNFLDKKVMPAQAAFNREVGATSEGAGKLKSEAMSAGVEFELLGKSFQEGAKFVTDYGKALQFTSLATKTNLKLGKELSLVVGLSAEEAGKLVMQFEKQGESATEVRQMFGVAETGAKQYGLAVNQVLRDLGQSPEVLARFGTANRKEFAVAAVKARSYGLSLKDINQAFGKQLDTFEGSSTAAAKLNSIFGTQINSFRLMLETDPTKRMEMLRKELVKQGKEWNNLNVFEKNVITQTMGVNEETAALILSSEKERKKLESKRREKEKQIKVDEKWNKQLGQIKETLIAWEPLLDRLMRAVANFTARLFGFEGAGDVTADTAKSVENAIGGITAAVENATKEIDAYKHAWDSIFSPNDLARAEEAAALVERGLGSLNAREQLKLTQTIQNSDQRDMLKRILKNTGGMGGEEVDRIFKAYGNNTHEQALSDINAGAKRVANRVNVMHAKDALITKDGKVVKFDPNDNILATKGNPLGNAGGGEQVIHINLHMDGKKIGEEIVKISRN
jgi:hypothetical protein